MRERTNDTMSYILLFFYVIMEKSIYATLKGSFIAFLVSICIWMINVWYKHKIVDYMMEDSWE